MNACVHNIFVNKKRKKYTFVEMAELMIDKKYGCFKTVLLKK